MNTLFVIHVILLVIIGIAKAISDTINFKFNQSIFNKIKNDKIRNWFNPQVSWTYKYKNNDPKQGPKFIGSTTIFVWLTDAWHFFQSLMLTSYELIILSTFIYFTNFSFIVYLAILFSLKLLRGLCFELFLKITT